MVCSWNKLVGVILILIKMTSLIQCFCDWRVPYFPVYYPELGNDFIIDILDDGERYIWRKDGKPLNLQTCDGSSDHNCTKAHRIYRNWGRGDLCFKKITLEDSGKYILELFCSDGSKRINSFEIIVQDKPSVLTGCNDMTVYEGENVTCVCKTPIGYPTASVTWLQTELEQGNSGMKYFTDILTLGNISKNESGMYTCLANSSNFINMTSFNLTVVPKNSRVEIKYFKVFQEVGDDYSKLFLLCKAEGFPQLKYTILHNRTAVTFGDRYIVDARKMSSLGQYECLARHGASSDGRLLLLNASFLVKPCLEKEKRKAETEWKIRLIVGACSFIAGILVLYVLMCSCKKCKKKEDDSENSEYDDVCPRIAQETRASEKHEMRLHYASGKLEEERQSAEYDEPEAGNSDDHVYYNESNYHEFNGFRHLDEERYHACRFESNRFMNF